MNNAKININVGRHSKAFSLLEMLIVLAIIGIVMLATLPAGGGKIDRVRISETIGLVKSYQPSIERYYKANKEFPADNTVIGMPLPDRIIGNYLTAAYMVDGAIHLQLGNKMRPKLRGKLVSLRPVFVPGTDNTPVSWICGYDTVPANMVAAGENRTDVESLSLPTACR